MLYMASTKQVDEGVEESAKALTYCEAGGAYLEDLSPEDIEVYLETQKKRECVEGRKPSMGASCLHLQD
jgi:hypothetical protein